MNTMVACFIVHEVYSEMFMLFIRLGFTMCYRTSLQIVSAPIMLNSFARLAL